MQLLVSSNNVGNPLTLDLTGYVNVQAGEGMDPYDPAFREAVISHSLLKEGGTLALEDLKAKELIYPLLLSSTSAGGLATLVQQINQAVGSPGATASWRDDGMSQATTFDLISGQLDIQYDYRRAQRFWLAAKLRLFTQPLGRTAGPRPYAAASGYGPLLWLSGAGPPLNGAASGGQQYLGSPSLAGDAPALLQLSYVGPLPNGATEGGQVPFVAVSVLPDPEYDPLIGPIELVPAMVFAAGATAVSQFPAAGAVEDRYQSLILPVGGGSAAVLWSSNLESHDTQPPTLLSAGSHRLLAIARASGGQGAMIGTLANPLVPYATTASVAPGLDWGLYDLGTFALRASETPQAQIYVGASMLGNASAAVDVTALYMLPESSTWFLNPRAIRASQYGYPPGVAPPGQYPGAYTNTVLVDDVLGDQFLYDVGSQTFAPNPVGLTVHSSRITQFTRGVVPRPDPRNGVPAIVVLGVGQAAASPSPFGNGASWSNQQTLGTMAQVNVLERTRYVFP